MDKDLASILCSLNGFVPTIIAPFGIVFTYFPVMRVYATIAVALSMFSMSAISLLYFDETIATVTICAAASFLLVVDIVVTGAVKATTTIAVSDEHRMVVGSVSSNQICADQEKNDDTEQQKMEIRLTLAYSILGSLSYGPIVGIFNTIVSQVSGVYDSPLPSAGLELMINYDSILLVVVAGGGVIFSLLMLRRSSFDVYTRSHPDQSEKNETQSLVEQEGVNNDQAAKPRRLSAKVVPDNEEGAASS